MEQILGGGTWVDANGTYQVRQVNRYLHSPPAGSHHQISRWVTASLPLPVPRFKHNTCPCSCGIKFWQLDLLAILAGTGAFRRKLVMEIRSSGVVRAVLGGGGRGWEGYYLGIRGDRIGVRQASFWGRVAAHSGNKLRTVHCGEGGRNSVLEEETSDA